MSMPSKPFVITNCARAWACDSRPEGEPRTLATTAPLNWPPALFLIVGMSSVPVIAARIVGSSAPELRPIEPSLPRLYQPGFDSVIAPAWRCTVVSAFGSHVGIHTLVVYAAVAGNAAPKNSSSAVSRDRIESPCDHVLVLNSHSAAQPSRRAGPVGF